MNSLKILEHINYSIGKNLILDISKFHNLEKHETNFLLDKFLNRPAEMISKKKLILE